MQDAKLWLALVIVVILVLGLAALSGGPEPMDAWIRSR